ncbi:hypothetical protein EV715DRAFT_262803 [Schizophyllum commune]
MAPSKANEKENINPRRRSHRNQVQRDDARHKAAEDAEAARQRARKEKAEKKRRKQMRRAERARRLAVEQEGDSEELRKVREALARVTQERDAAVEANTNPHNPPHSPEPIVDSIRRPHRVSDVTIEEIREHLGLDGQEHKSEWSDIRRATRSFMLQGGLDITKDWTELPGLKLIKIYDAIEEYHPPLRRFKNQWATAVLIHKTFQGQHSYYNTKDKQGTYRYKRRKALRQYRESLRSAADTSGDEEASYTMTRLHRRRRSESEDRMEGPSSIPLQTGEGRGEDRGAVAMQIEQARHSGVVASESDLSDLTGEED